MKVLRRTTNISLACGIMQINRSTFYRWLKKGKQFADAYEEVSESKIDFAESALFLVAGSRERWAVQEILRSKRGRARGYGRTLQLEGPDGNPIPVKLYEGIDDAKFPPKGEGGSFGER